VPGVLAVQSADHRLALNHGERRSETDRGQRVGARSHALAAVAMTCRRHDRRLADANPDGATATSPVERQLHAATLAPSTPWARPLRSTTRRRFECPAFCST